MAQRNFGIVPILYTDNLCKIPIPNFKKEIKQKITKEYYNHVNSNNNLTAENYLEKEIERNSIIGIHQLNSEIFKLKETLEDVIDKIIKEQTIEIEF